MSAIDKLLAGYRSFREERYAQQEALFNQLARGQEPKIMVIACADSRADPSMIFSAAPGELFVVRNVANLVPPYECEGQFHGTSAALEYAINNLKVSDIVVMGHASCGGIGACLSAGNGQPTGQFIGPWVSRLSDLRDKLKSQTDRPHGELLQLRMEQAAIGHSLETISSYPFAKAALDKGRLQLHGAWFSIASGELHWRNSHTGDFSPVALAGKAA